MKIILFLLLAAGALLAFLLLALLLLPFSYRVKGGCREEGLYAGGGISQKPLYSLFFDYSPQSVWLHLIVFFIPLKFKINPQIQKEKNSKSGKKSQDMTSIPSKGSRQSLKILLKRSTLGHILSLAQNLLGILKPEKLVVRGEIGLEEPHLLGWFLASLWSLKSLSNHMYIDVKPIWDREHYNLEVYLEGKLVPGVILFYLLRFLFSRKTLEIWRHWRRQKKVYKSAT